MRSFCFILIGIGLVSPPASAAGGSETLHAAMQGSQLQLSSSTDKSAHPLPCQVDHTYSTGERIRCGSGSLYYELLHTFGDTGGGAVVHGREGEKRINHFFRCEYQEQGKTLVGAACQLTADRPEKIADRDLVSPIKATLAELPIPNAHEVDHDGLIFRSMAPKTANQFDALKAFGIQEVLIFKNGPAADIDPEIAELKKRGIEVHHIAFPWKDFPGSRPVCDQTLDALRILLQARAQHRKILIHCTVGEDRTGYLSGLYRLLTEGGDRRALFSEEMCERGYDLGDPYKPYRNVSLKIRDATTRLYLEMSDKIAHHQFKTNQLDEAVCATLQPPSAGLLADYTCRTSTRFRPDP